MCSEDQRDHIHKKTWRKCFVILNNIIITIIFIVSINTSHFRSSRILSSAARFLFVKEGLKLQTSLSKKHIFYVTQKKKKEGLAKTLYVFLYAKIWYVLKRISGLHITSVTVKSIKFKCSMHVYISHTLKW